MSEGIRVHTGVTDTDYTGEIKIMMSSTKPWKGGKIAQWPLLPHCPVGTSNNVRGDKGFGSSGKKGVFLTENILRLTSRM